MVNHLIMVIIYSGAMAGLSRLTRSVTKQPRRLERWMERMMDLGDSPGSDGEIRPSIVLGDHWRYVHGIYYQCIPPMYFTYGGM